MPRACVLPSAGPRPDADAAVCSQDSKGELIVSKGPAAFRDWNRSRSLETALTALRAEMAKNGNNKLAQPAEGLMYT
jgi:hypothetical protein